MKRRHALFTGVLDAANLDFDLNPKLPVVELAGDNRVLIENHRGVAHYSLTQVVVLVSYGKVVIEGCSLKLAKLGRDQLVVTGSIGKILLCKEGAR